MRMFLNATVVLLAMAVPSWATAQFPEKLIRDGKELPMYSTPLASYLEHHPDVKLPSPGASSTALWRGYVGTWSIKEDKLFLVKIEQQEVTKNKGGEFDFGWREVPLNRIFPKAKGPVLADWHNGVLRVPQGKELHYIHMGFESIYEEDMLFLIEKGRVIRSIELKNVDADPFRSHNDRRWVALGDPAAPVKDAGDWMDARLLETSIGIAEIKQGKTIKTRGEFWLLDDDEDESKPKQPALYIERTKTDLVLIKLTGVVTEMKLEPGSRVEIEGVVSKDVSEIRMKVTAARNLKIGESIHAATYPEVYKKLNLGKHESE